MSPPLLASLIVVVLGGGAWVLTRLPPRRALAALVFALAGGLALARQFALAAPLAAIGLGIWRSAQSIPSGNGQSEVETDGLRMTLDHASGEMDGEVLTGPFTGRRLSELSPAERRDLWDALETDGDMDSIALLNAWLERRGGGAGPSEPPPRPDGAPMSEAEAYRVLGLTPDATVTEVREAHRRLMKRVHPDLGGSGALAALINAAKERLDPG